MRITIYCRNFYECTSLLLVPVILLYATTKLPYIQTHQAQCKYTPVKCSNDGCQNLLSRDKFKQHLDVECLYRNIHCEYCDEVTMPIKLEVSLCKLCLIVELVLS